MAATAHATARPDWIAIRSLLSRRRWWFLLPFVAGWAVVASLFWLLPAQYQAQALLLVEHQAVPPSYVTPNITFNPEQLLQSMGLQVLSHDRLAEVVRAHRLYPALQRRHGMDAAIAKLQKQITIAPVSLASLPNPPPGEWSALRIAFTASTPALAQAVDNDLTTSFIQQNLRATQQASADITSFLQQQLQEAAAARDQAQTQVESFERSNLGLLPGQGQANLALAMNLQTQLSAQLAARDQTQLQIAADRALVAQVPTPAVQQMQQQMQSLEDQMRDLRGRYTARYPEVMHLQQQIAALKIQLAAQPGKSTRPAKDAAAASSPALLQARSQLQADDALLPRQQVQVSTLERQLRRYQRRLTLAPVPASQLAGLEAQQQQAETSYQTILAKLNSSQMASELEQQQGGAQFRLVNAPDYPRQPVWPKPATLTLLGLLAGVCLGLGVSAAAELTEDRLHAENELAALGVRPVLARIPPLRTVREQASRRLRYRLEWAAASALVALVVAGSLWLLLLGN
ncbi:MAG: hypothetical protein ACRD04_13700 [Terriglobales bacterium]